MGGLCAGSPSVLHPAVDNRGRTDGAGELSSTRQVPSLTRLSIVVASRFGISGDRLLAYVTAA